MTDLLDRFAVLPRAARWALVALAVVLLYFALIEPVIDRYNTYSGRADDRLAALRDLRRRAAQGDSGAAALGVRRFGLVELPGDPELRSVAFNRKVTEILQKHGVTRHNSTTRNVPLGATGPLAGTLGQNERIDRVVREVQFDAEPEAISAVLADLERTPEVAAVSRVQLRRASAPDGPPRALNATIAAEAWVITRRERAR
jgi:hypothetical protein